MPILEDAKRTIERVTGYGRPDAGDPGLLTQARKPHLLRFKDDGETPNNSRLAMILYRSPVRLPDRFDPAGLRGIIRSEWLGGFVARRDVRLPAFSYAHARSARHSARHSSRRIWRDWRQEAGPEGRRRGHPSGGDRPPPTQSEQRTPDRRGLPRNPQRNRWFADSPVEGEGFEPSVPRPR